MGDKISDEELHQLIAAAKESKSSPAGGSGTAGTSAFDRAALSYDFRRPQRVNKDQSRRMESIHEQFARMFSATLSSNMRMVIDVDLAFCDQIVYQDFILSLANPCTAYSFTLEPHGGQAILAFGNELIMAVVDRAFGGQGRGFTGDARALTPIEMNIINKLATRISTDLEATWEPVARVEITEVALETNPKFIQIAAPQDGVLVVAFEANARSATGLVHLCYPLNSLDPLLPRLTPSPRDRTRRDSVHVVRQQRALGNMKIPVQIEVARGSLPLNEVAGLQVGDVVKLDTSTSDSAIIFVGDRPKYFGRVGLQGNKRAVKITQRIAPGAEDLYR
ncbi:MAG: flagellar motor switch protein FliM [bacterium]|nr:flagellar motor switch protein FliM [bacterium]